jgi:hypothetical protein
VMDEVLEVGVATVAPVAQVVTIGPCGRAVASRKAATRVAEEQRGTEVGRDRARGPSDRERLNTIALDHRGPIICKRRNPGHCPHRVAGDAACGVRVDRTHAAQLGGLCMRAGTQRVLATQLGRLCIGARAQRGRAAVTVRWDRCPCTSRWSPQRSWVAAMSTSASARRWEPTGFLHESARD